MEKNERILRLLPQIYGDPLDQELRFVYTMRALRTYKKLWISSKVQKREFGGNQGLHVRRLSQGSNGSYTLQEVWILPTLVYFPPEGHLTVWDGLAV